MSASVVFSIFDDIDYENKVLLTNKLTEYCLSKNLGVIFNASEVNANAIKAL